MLMHVGSDAVVPDETVLPIGDTLSTLDIESESRSFPGEHIGVVVLMTAYGAGEYGIAIVRMSDDIGRTVSHPCHPRLGIEHPRHPVLHTILVGDR